MSNTKTNWATRTKETLAKTTIAVPAGMQVRSRGNSEPIIAYYRFTEPRTPNALSRVMNAGDTFEGTYEGKYASESYPDNFTYKVRTSEGLIGLPNCKQLSDDLGTLPNGTKVFVAYKGQESVKKGKFAGKPRHAFLVASEPVSSGDSGEVA